MVENILNPIIISVLTSIISTIIGLTIFFKTERFRSKLKKTELQFEIDYKQWSETRKHSSTLCYKILNLLKIAEKEVKEDCIKQLDALFHELQAHLYDKNDPLKINRAFLLLHEFKNTYGVVVDNLKKNTLLDWKSNIVHCEPDITKMKYLYEKWREQIDIQNGK